MRRLGGLRNQVCGKWFDVASGQSVTAGIQAARE